MTFEEKDNLLNTYYAEVLKLKTFLSSTDYQTIRESEGGVYHGSNVSKDGSTASWNEKDYKDYSSEQYEEDWGRPITSQFNYVVSEETVLSQELISATEVIEPEFPEFSEMPLVDEQAEEQVVEQTVEHTVEQTVEKTDEHSEEQEEQVKE